MRCGHSTVSSADRLRQAHLQTGTAVDVTVMVTRYVHIMETLPSPSTETAIPPLILLLPARSRGYVYVYAPRSVVVTIHQRVKIYWSGSIQEATLSTILRVGACGPTGL